MKVLFKNLSHTIFIVFTGLSLFMLSMIKPLYGLSEHGCIGLIPQICEKFGVGNNVLFTHVALCILLSFLIYVVYLRKHTLIIRYLSFVTIPLGLFMILLYLSAD